MSVVVSQHSKPGIKRENEAELHSTAVSFFSDVNIERKLVFCNYFCNLFLVLSRHTSLLQTLEQSYSSLFHSISVSLPRLSLHFYLMILFLSFFFHQSILSVVIMLSQKRIFTDKRREIKSCCRIEVKSTGLDTCPVA